MKTTIFLALLLWSAMPAKSQDLGNPSFVSVLNPTIQPFGDEFYYLNNTPADYGFNDKVKIVEIFVLKGGHNLIPTSVKMIFNDDAKLGYSSTLFNSEKFEYDEVFGALERKEIYRSGEEYSRTQTIVSDGVNITKIELSPRQEHIDGYNLDPERAFEYMTFQYDMLSLSEVEHYSSRDYDSEIQYYFKLRYVIKTETESPLTKTIEVHRHEKDGNYPPYEVITIVYGDKQKEIRGTKESDGTKFEEIISLNAAKQPIKSVRTTSSATAEDVATGIYTYNSNKQLISYTYQSTENIAFEKAVRWAEMGGGDKPEKPTETKYEIKYTYDSNGNWIKIEKKDLVGTDDLVLEATISY